jgi:glycerophosphoryl diester phosphodiesterase
MKTKQQILSGQELNNLLLSYPNKQEPLVLAHRGSHQDFPENSLTALLAAAKVADGFETDIRQTADGVLVLAHDPTSPDGQLIDQHTYHELNPLFPDGLARLDEFLTFVSSGVFAILEIKVPNIDHLVYQLAAPVFGPRLRLASFIAAQVQNVPLDQRWLIVHGRSEVPASLTDFAGLAARADAYPFKLVAKERAAWQVAVPVLPVLLVSRVGFLITDQPRAVRTSLKALFTE